MIEHAAVIFGRVVVTLAFLGLVAYVLVTAPR